MVGAALRVTAPDVEPEMEISDLKSVIPETLPMVSVPADAPVPMFVAAVPEALMFVVPTTAIAVKFTPSDVTLEGRSGDQVKFPFPSFMNVLPAEP